MVTTYIKFNVYEYVENRFRLEIPNSELLHCTQNRSVVIASASSIPNSAQKQRSTDIIKIILLILITVTA